MTVDDAHEFCLVCELRDAGQRAADEEDRRHTLAVQAADHKRAWCRDAFKHLFAAPYYMDSVAHDGTPIRIPVERDARETWLQVEAAWNEKPDHL